MNVQHNLIWVLVLYELKLDFNSVESEDAFDHSSYTRWFKKFCLGCKNLNYQVRSYEMTDQLMKYTSLIWTGPNAIKGEGSVDHRIVTRWFQKFCLGLTEFWLSESLVGLKLWISRLCSKPWRQIWWTVFGEYQARSASHSLECFFTFMTW